MLDRLKVAGPDAADWNRLHAIYFPLIERWLSRVPGLGDESADVAQEVLVVVFREIPRFERQREGSFRAWLRKVTVNRVLNQRRQRQRRPAVGLDPADGFLARLSDSNGDLAHEWDRDHDRHVVEKLMAVVQSDFTPITWEAFRRFGIEVVPAALAAQELGLRVCESNVGRLSLKLTGLRVIIFLFFPGCSIENSGVSTVFRGWAATRACQAPNWPSRRRAAIWRSLAVESRLIHKL